MTSANAPILNKILTELSEFKTEMYAFRNEMYTFRNEFYEFRDNVNYFRRGLVTIQEKSDAEFFRQYLTNNFPTLNVELHSFGNFYGIDGHTITDIDGCVSVDSFPKKPNLRTFSKNNSIHASSLRNELFFIESKNFLDKVNFDMKIPQFTQIMQILSKLPSIETKDSMSAVFNEMIEHAPLKTKPTIAYFVFSANDLSLGIRTFIKNINEGTLTEDNYKEATCKMFLDHSMYRKIGTEIKHKVAIKKRYMKAKSFDEFIDIFQDSIFEIYRPYLSSFFIEYTSVAPLYAKVKGLLGHIFYENVYLPPRFS